MMDSRPFTLALLLLVVTGPFCSTVRSQDETSDGGALVADQDVAATSDAGESAEPTFGAIERELSARFNDGLNAISGFMFTNLFFDLSFGALQEPVLDEDGNPVYSTKPKTSEATGVTNAVVLSPELQPILDSESKEVRTAEVAAGTELYELDADGAVVMVDDKPATSGPTLPFLVVFLAIGATFYTFYHGFINVRAFRHAVDIVRGKYTSKDLTGDLPPFKALTSALSATVGLGNIASVSVAMVTGGPGALFWMVILGVIGMSAKFHETTLAQMYRIKNEHGTISGGPMYFIDRGFRELHPALAPVGKLLAIMFAMFLMGAALGGGNMFQANQSFEGFFSQFVAPNVSAENHDIVREYSSYGFGLVMACLVAVVVIGGIARIGMATSVIVPFMAVIYVAACITIIVTNAAALPALISEIFTEAFAFDSAFGGFIGVMMIGFQRAAFSSESGIGSSAVAHSAAQTKEPVQEGMVASLEPFIDTVVICTLTGLVVLITGAYNAEGVEGGSAVTLYAFKQKAYLASWFPYILSVCIVLFAFSTMISWCYYGERAWGYLFGIRSTILFRMIFVVCVFIGSVASLSPVIDLADAMLLSCALPNIIGGVVLAPKVRAALKDYWARHKAGEFN